MRSLVITVAGMSIRFNKDTQETVLKCLYYENTPAHALLSQQVRKMAPLVDEIVVVGGYQYHALEQFVQAELNDVAQPVRLVFNEHYADYGSCYSLLKGIEAASAADELIFMEGDLAFDTESVKKLVFSGKDALSVNAEPILSQKAVALYFDRADYPHYLYDTGHACLEIHEPFTAIYNSAQIWKFRQPERLREISRSLTLEEKKGTNLEVVQRYFGALKGSQIEIVTMDRWFNCNTVADYREAVKAWI